MSKWNTRCATKKYTNFTRYPKNAIKQQMMLKRDTWCQATLKGKQASTFKSFKLYDINVLIWNDKCGNMSKVFHTIFTTGLQRSSLLQLCYRTDHKADMWWPGRDLSADLLQFRINGKKSSLNNAPHFLGFLFLS